MERRVPFKEWYSTIDSVETPRSPLPGEIVIIHDKNPPRSFWKLRRVTDIIKGDDSQIHGAAVDVATNGKPQTLRRPITHLYPLEVTSDTKKSPIIQDNSAQNVTVDVPLSRPVRAAAQRTWQQVWEWISDDTDHVYAIVCCVVCRWTLILGTLQSWPGVNLGEGEGGGGSVM